MYILTFIYKQKILKKNGTEQNTCRVESVYLAEIICNNLLPLCNRETLVYDLPNVPGTRGAQFVIDIRTKWFGNFWQVRVIEGQFAPREPKLVRVIRSFENSRVRETGGEIIKLEWSETFYFEEY